MYPSSQLKSFKQFDTKSDNRRLGGADNSSMSKSQISRAHSNITDIDQKSILDKKVHKI